MDAFYIISISLLGFLLLYIIIKSQISKMMEEKLQVLYRDRISSDIQEFYRELENYSSIIDSRIGRLKTLTERHEANLKSWDNIQKELKKTKTGKELLTYLDENQQKFKPDKEFSTNLKNEIITELKSYLANKLNLSQDPVKKANTQQSRPVSQTSRDTTDIPAKRIKEVNDDSEGDINIAELILDDMDNLEKRKRPAMTKNISSESVSTRSQMNNALLNSSANTHGTEKYQGVNTFLNILKSIGQALSPLFMKTENTTPMNNTPSSQAPGNTWNTANSDIRRKDNAKQNSFNDMIKKEMVTTTLLAGSELPKNAKIQNYAENGDIQSDETIPKIPKEKFIKSMEPNDLIKCIEQLKISKSRPDALKQLLNQGFQMEQIAELSNIPYSDLELTRNLYGIDAGISSSRNQDINS